MKELAKQDRNGTRTTTDLERKYRFRDTAEKADEASEGVKTIDEKLESKVDKVTGKGLSTNDFTNTLKTKLDSIEPNADVNIIESISINGTQQTPANKNVNLLINNNFTDDYKNQVDANTLARHTHSNKALLDTYTQTEANLADAVTNKHSHTNKAVLDGITSSNISRWSNIAFYESGGSTNVNTTTEELVLSSTNTPDSSLWYVQTIFYNSKSATSNRVQIAYGYSANKPIMSRYYINSSWTAWTSKDVISSSFSDYEGYVWFANGLLEQWGRASITPTAANTVTSATITFPYAYDNAPHISAIPQVGTPNIVTTAVGGGTTLAAAKSSMIIYTTRTNTTATNYRWKAIGYKNPY